MPDWFDGDGAGSLVDVAALLDSGVYDLLRECVSVGALVSLGRTSDGGALGITITVDGRWRREYFRDAETAMTWLSAGLPAITEACERRSSSSVDGSRQRRRRGL